MLVDFWTYSCINCLREAPYIKAWEKKYQSQGLVVIGVHTPEFRFETNIDNIKHAIDREGITYPVAVDSDRRIWDAFNNHYWPALYFIDAQGRIRHHQYGEGNYDLSERVIQALLSERGSIAGTEGKDGIALGEGAEAPPDLDDIGSAETYLGYDRQAGFVSASDLRAEVSSDYSLPALALNQWGLQGTWTVNPDKVILDKQQGTIAYRFHARDLHLVLGRVSGTSPVHFQVLIDGKAPGADHGVDTGPDGKGVVSETRLYQLVRQKGSVTDHTFEIRFDSPGVEAYSFTFG
ncbi:cytochrome c biogenesis protein [Neokomagataea thailandica NBRC 106555]|uniref:Cytochrome c biogenesis protein n=1 Tax=Neokomagataea thailandica NBRC 106555 TaxID=1223520 RepID=A0ABQ0QN52_9PROT|nr:cytochrome c biogenesis protein [Neokomagataea thailandica NBRC 106555]